MAKKNKIKLPKGAGKQPSKANLKWNLQGPGKRTAVFDVEFGPGNTMKVTIEYNYTNVPPELIDLLDAQYADALNVLEADAVTTADEALKFATLAANTLAAGLVEVQLLTSED